MIRIVTDSVASIPREVAEKIDVDVVSLYLHHNGEQYEDATMDVEAFYADIYDMVDNIPTSSQPSQGEMESVFEKAAEAGDEVVGVFMSARMSGTFEGALRAARNVMARHTDFRYRIIDSMSNSFDEAFAVFAAVAGREAGCSLDQCAEVAAQSAASSRFLFTPESLRFLKAGGRIGNVSALLGSLMRICPIITVSDGESSTFAKVRSHKKALAAMIDKFKSDVDSCGLRNAVVHYIGAPDEARAWSRAAVEPIVGHAVEVLPVSPVIGLHVGPAIGIAYECERVLEGKLSVNPSRLVYAS